MKKQTTAISQKIKIPPAQPLPPPCRRPSRPPCPCWHPGRAGGSGRGPPPHWQLVVEEHLGGELVVVNDKTISLVHEGGGGQFLASRSWGGLEQQLGQTEVKEVVQGRKGIAAGYEGEPGVDIM